MSNNEKQERKLRQHEKPIWRKAFEESMKHTSIEGATRNAWKAVDAWHNAGAFNEPQPLQPSESEGRESESRYRIAFRDLLTFYEENGQPENDEHEDIVHFMQRFDDTDMSNDEFKTNLFEVGD